MQDDNRDRRIDEHEADPARGQPVTAGQPNDPTMYRSTSTPGAAGAAIPTERAPAGHRADETQRLTTDRPASSGTADTYPRTGATYPQRERMPDHRDVDRTDDEVTVVAGPRPRASLLATLSLIFGLAGALFVLTGALAGYGIALGAIALLLAFAGLSATSRRHVAGKSDALLGLLLGLAAVGAGVLAVTGQFDWPNTDGDTVQRFRDWLDAQTVDRF
jgi:uncharacterized membrane protein YphA (DoxX/SURF4 family)